MNSVNKTFCAFSNHSFSFSRIKRYTWNLKQRQQPSSFLWLSKSYCITKKSISSIYSFNGNSWQKKYLILSRFKDILCKGYYCNHLFWFCIQCKIIIFRKEEERIKVWQCQEAQFFVSYTESNIFCFIDITHNLYKKQEKRVEQYYTEIYSVNINNSINLIYNTISQKRYDNSKTFSRLQNIVLLATFVEGFADGTNMQNSSVQRIQNEVSTVSHLLE